MAEPARRVSLWPLLATIVGIGITVALGTWQLGRAQEKREVKARLDARSAEPPVRISAAEVAVDDVELRRVEARGAFEPRHTVYLDNRIQQGVPGYHVVTPLRIEGSDAVVLVQRGWAPRNFTQREVLPAVQTPAGAVEVRGRLAPPPAKLYAFDTEEKGPIRQNLDLARFRAETGLPLLELSVQQAGPASEGLLRQWPRAGSGAEKNYGYAFQWWALCALIAILYVWFQLVLPFRRARRA